MAYWCQKKRNINDSTVLTRPKSARDFDDHISDICDYVHQLLNPCFNGRPFPKNIAKELNDELEERVYTADVYAYTEPDFELIINSGGRFVPSKCLLKYLLQRRLNPFSRNLSPNDMTGSTHTNRDFFRHRVKHDLVYRAHGSEALVFYTPGCPLRLGNNRHNVIHTYCCKPFWHQYD